MPIKLRVDHLAQAVHGMDQRFALYRRGKKQDPAVAGELVEFEVAIDLRVLFGPIHEPALHTGEECLIPIEPVAEQQVLDDLR